MKTIYKYDLDICDEQTIQLPRMSELVHVGEQDGRLKLWVLLDPEEELENYLIHIRGTGHPIDADDAWLYIGTVVMSCGLVWHVFEDWSK